MCSYGNKASTSAQVVMQFVLQINEAIITGLPKTVKNYYSRKDEEQSMLPSSTDLECHAYNLWPIQYELCHDLLIFGWCSLLNSPKCNKKSCFIISTNIIRIYEAPSGGL